MVTNTHFFILMVNFTINLKILIYYLNIIRNSATNYNLNMTLKQAFQLYLYKLHYTHSQMHVHKIHLSNKNDHLRLSCRRPVTK